MDWMPRADIETCLSSCKPDGVIVATPQFTHRSVAEACIRAGVGVLTEKPLAHTLDDARAMAKLASENPAIPADDLSHQHRDLRAPHRALLSPVARLG